MNHSLMKRLPGLMGVAAAALLLQAGTAFAAHPNIPLMTYEELAYQFNMKDMATGAGAMPVMIQNNAMGQPTGFPYSPKATCGDCHNGGLTKVSDGLPIRKADGSAITTALVSYMDMSSKAFHAELGSQSWTDTTNATDGSNLSSTPQPGKPWSQTTGMWGKW